MTRNPGAGYLHQPYSLAVMTENHDRPLEIPHVPVFRNEKNTLPLGVVGALALER